MFHFLAAYKPILDCLCCRRLEIPEDSDICNLEKEYEVITHIPSENKIDN